MTSYAPLRMTPGKYIAGGVFYRMLSSAKGMEVLSDRLSRTG